MKSAVRSGVPSTPVISGSRLRMFRTRSPEALQVRDRPMVKNPLLSDEDRLVGHRRCEDCAMPTPPRLSLAALVIAIAIAIAIGIFAAALTIPPV
jgi:hypothetical protein